MPFDSRRAVLTLAGLIALSAVVVRDAALPPDPVPASAPATEFSSERALRHVTAIAERPHPIGSADNARVRDYLLAELRALGLDPQIQDATGIGTRYRTAGRVRNVLARLPGRTPGGLAVVLMSHYDGVGGGPAASDAGAGVAAILETLRAIKAGSPLEHDVIALITDGEEAGLLGAAAFAREHPWAKDVGVTLNFEARGTAGRSYMFETGSGNLDVARVLRSAPDVSATSLSVTVYRLLPNDTDLSEIAVLDRPALNFAFADGVARYHTAHDDVAHLDQGSLRHHGSQALALARAFGNGPLPRPSTGDAVFFDLPIVGLVVYPATWSLPLAVAAVMLVLAAVVRTARTTDRWLRSVALGVAGSLCAIALAGAGAHVAGMAIGRAHDAMGWGGAPAFRGIYATAMAVLAVALALTSYAAGRRWGNAVGLHIGALVVWAVLALLVSLRLPGVSFLLTWPLIVATIAAHVSIRTTAGTSRSEPGTSVASSVTFWIATIVATAIVLPVVYAVSAVLLGAIGAGGIAAAVLTALLAWLLAPQLEWLAAGRHWRVAGIALVVALGLFGTGTATVRASSDYPVSSSALLVMQADSSDAWLVTRGISATARADTAAASVPSWVTSIRGPGGTPAAYMRMPRASIEPPTATVLADSATGGGRALELRVRAAPGTEVVSIRLDGPRVARAVVDGHLVDTTRYRSPVRQWQLEYAGPPDSGFTLGLTLAEPGEITLGLTARSPGLPAGVPLPARGPTAVTIHSGDATFVRRTSTF